MMGEPLKLQPRVGEMGWSHNSEARELERRIAENVAKLREEEQ